MFDSIVASGAGSRTDDVVAVLRRSDDRVAHDVVGVTAMGSTRLPILIGISCSSMKTPNVSLVATLIGEGLASSRWRGPAQVGAPDRVLVAVQVDRNVPLLKPTGSAGSGTCWRRRASSG